MFKLVYFIETGRLGETFAEAQSRGGVSVSMVAQIHEDDEGLLWVHTLVRKMDRTAREGPGNTGTIIEVIDPTVPRGRSIGSIHGRSHAS